MYFDFLVLPETHCLSDEFIEIDNYTIFQNNRNVKGSRTHGSGGIAIAVNNCIFNYHSIVSFTKGIDGQISLKIKNNLNEFTIGILGLYLSPQNYIYGNDPETFFNEAAVLWDDLSDCDLRIGSGDLNARTKNILMTSSQM